MLRDEFQYFLAHQDELVQKYRGKVLVIKNQQVIGVYDSDADAYYAAKAEHELGTFLIQRCDPGPEAYTQSFNARVKFA